MTFVVRLSLLLPALVLPSVGCVSNEASDPREGVSAQAVCTQVAHAGGATTSSTCSYPWAGQQGRLLEGLTNPEVRTVVPSDATVTARVDATGHITLTGPSGALGDSYLLSHTFTATGSYGGTSTLQVTAIYPPNNDPADPNYGRYQYVVTQDGGAPLCDNPPTVLPPLLPLGTPVRAIAEAGAWVPQGIYFPTAVGISFACRSGVVAKCDRWGYGANTTWPTTTAHGRSIFVSGADVHNTCTRMARADYCSQGLPNTLDGTPIYIEDNFHLREAQPGYVAEAAWRDVAWDDHGTPGKPVICLSKLRWSTLPLGGDCPLTVPDPRVTSKAKFCDDYSDAQLDAAGAILFSSSAFIDAGLNSYYNADTGQRLTTTKLQQQGYPLPPAWTIPAPAEIKFPTGKVAFDTPRFEATLLATQLPAGFDSTGLLLLNSFECKGSPVTTVDKPESCNLIAAEGYLYPPNSPGRAPLRRWRSQVGESWTTVTSPTTMWAQGFQMTEVIGNVIRAALDVNVRWTAVPSTSYALDIQLRTGAWITSCIAAATIGSATSTVYSGQCTGANNTQVNHNDIVAFRMNYNGHYVTVPYDGVSSDVYLPATGAVPALSAQQIKASVISAVTFTWKDSGNVVYDLQVAGSDGVMHLCAPSTSLANDTSYVHTGTCPTGYALAPRSVVQVQLCALDKKSGDKRACTAAKLDGRTPALPLKW